MPDVEVERKLLCRCGHDDASHPNRGGKDEHCFRCAGTGEKGWWHPFDGVPYVRCPECGGIGTHDVLDASGLTVRDVSTCTSCHGSGWVPAND